MLIRVLPGMGKEGNMWIQTDSGKFVNTDLIAYLFVGFDSSTPRGKGSWCISSDKIFLDHFESEEDAKKELLEVIKILNKKGE